MAYDVVRVRPCSRVGWLLCFTLVPAALLLTADLPAAAAPRERVVSLEPVSLVAPEPPEGFVAPSAVAVDHRGRLLVADAGRHLVASFDRHGGFEDEFGGFGWESGLLDEPVDLAVLRGFRIYVLEAGNRRVSRFDQSGDYVDVVVGEGEAGTPVGMALGPSSELYLVDTDTQTVLVRSQFDEALTPFGRFGTGEGGLVRPVAVDVAPDLRVAVADAGRNAVLIFDQFGAQTGMLATADTLDPADVLFDRDGALYVADRRHRRVVVFPEGFTEPSASFDLTSLARRFEPVALARDLDDDIMVLDAREGLIARLRPARGERAGSR